MNKEKVLTEEIVEEIINNLKPEEKTLDFSEFTSSEVSLEFIQDQFLRSPEVYNFDGLKEIPDDFAVKMAQDFDQNSSETFSFIGLDEINETFLESFTRIPYGNVIFHEKFADANRSLFTLNAAKVKRIQEGDYYDDEKWLGFKFITGAAASIISNSENRAGFGSLIEITPEVAKALATLPGYLSFPSLSSIDLASAKELSNYSPILDRPALRLDGLRDLDEKTASELAKVRGKSFMTLSFDGLQTLSEGLAKSLSKFKGNKEKCGCLSLRGLESLSPNSAVHLAKIQHASIALSFCNLNKIKGLNSLEPAVAKALAGYKPNKVGSKQSLILDGLTEISNEALQELKVYQGGGIFLRGLSKVDEETAETLTLFKDGCGSYYRDWVPDDDTGPTMIIGQITHEMTPKAACILFSHFTNLELNLNELNTEMASLLAAKYKHDQNRMEFDRDLKSCSAEALEELIKYKGEIKLPGIVELDDECAEVLSKSTGVILDGLKEISKDGALNLLKGGVKTSDFICNLKEIGLGCIEDLTEIIPEIADVLATAGGDLSLPNVTEISEDIAKLFADSESEFKEIALDGLTSISPEVANLLSVLNFNKFSQSGLHLNGLSYLNVDLAKAFNSAPFPIHLNGIEEIDHESAVELVKDIIGHGGNVASWATNKKYYLEGLSSKKIGSDTAKILLPLQGGWSSRLITNIELKPLAEGFSD